MANLDTLTDDFTTPPLNTGKWTVALGGSSTGSATVTGGVLNFSVPTSAANNNVTVSSVATYAILNSYVLAKMTTNIAGNNQYVWMRVYSTTNGEEFLIQVRNGQITFTGIGWTGGGIANTSVTFSATNHAWWRIRHTGTTLYWETSPDAVTWTVRASAASYTPVSSSFRLELSAANTTNTAPLQTTTFDNVNVPPPKAETLTDEFPGAALDPAKWTTTLTGTAVSVTVAGGTLNYNTIAAADGSNTASVTSVNVYDLTNSHFAAQFTPTAASTAPTVTLMVTASATGEYFYARRLATGFMQLRGHDTTGTQFTTLNVTYDRDAMAWWRIRNASGTLYWETAPDGLTWTVRHSYAYVLAGPLYKVSLNYSWAAGIIAATSQVDNVNVIPVPAVPVSVASIGDPEAFGDPTLTTAVVVTAAADSLTDPQALGDPELAAALTLGADSAADPQTLGSPELTSSVPTGDGYPDGITDPGTVGTPTLGMAFPAGLTDPGAFGNPSLSGDIVFPPVATLIDDFTGPVIDSGKWSVSNNDQFLTASIIGGQLVFTVLAAGSASHSSTVYSNSRYSMTNSSIVVQAFPITSHTAPTTWFEVLGGAENFYIQKTGTNVVFRGYNSVGTQIATATVAYDAGSMAWWRIRHSGTALYWDTGYSDVGPWVQRLTSAYTPVNTQFQVRLICYWTGASSATTAKFDNLNNYPSHSTLDVETFGAPTVTATAQKMETLADDFAADYYLDPTKWTPVLPLAGGTGVQGSAGQMLIYLGAGRTPPYSVAASSTNVYDLIDSFAHAKMTPFLHAQTATYMTVRNPGNSKEYFQIFRQSTTIYFRAYDTNGNTLLANTAVYNATNHAWWRIRHTAGVIYLETAANGALWTQQGSYPYTPSSRALALRFEMAFLSGTSVDASSYIDNVNIDTAVRPLSITNMETFGEPTFSNATLDLTAEPDSIQDTEALGDPAATAGYPFLSTLEDDFPGTTLDTTKWTTYSTAAGFKVGVADGTLNLTTDPLGNATRSCGVYSGTYKFVGSSAFAQVTPSAHTSPTTSFTIQSLANAERFLISKTGTNLTCRGYDIYGTQITTVNVAYDSTAMAYWRIRNNAGVIYWETAPADIGPWTIRRQATYTIAGTDFRLDIGLQWIGATTATVTRADNVNLFPSYSINDPQQLGTPSTSFLLGDVTATPGSTTDPEAFGAPAATQINPDVTATPEGLNNQETLGEPTITKASSLPGGPVSTIIDDFEAPLDTELWQKVTPDGSAVAVNAGLLELHMPDGKLNPYTVALATIGLYDMTGSAIYVKATPYTLAGNTATGLWVRNTANPKEYFAIYYQSGVLRFYCTNTNGTNLLTTVVTYSATNHAWWRIRHTGTSIYMEASANGKTWTVIGGPVTYTPSIHTYRVSLELSRNSTTVPSSDSYAYFDNVNLNGYTLRPGAILEPETLDGPTHTFDGSPVGIPDPIYEPEFLPEHTATAAGTELIGVTADGINDPDPLGYPDVSGSAAAEPDSLSDTEILTGPSASAEAIEFESLIDPELFGLVAAIQADTPITVGELVDPETLEGPAADIAPYPTILVDPLTDPEEVGPPDVVAHKGTDNWSYGGGIYGDGIYSGYQAPPDSGHTANWTYGTGTYGYGIYYGLSDTTPPDGGETLPIAPPTDYPVAQQNLSMGPWSPGVEWRGAPNYQIPPLRMSRAQAEERSIGIATGGPTTTRPAMGLPPATRKGFTLRLNEGSEARVDLSMQRGDAVVIDEMDTDIWWRRKDPTTGKLEMIGRFNCAHADLTASDSGVNLSAQFVDYSVLLGDRLVLKYMRLGENDVPETMWDTGTAVMDIIDWALPLNTGIDMSQVRGPSRYNLGTITSAFDLPPGTLITDFLTNLKAKSRVSWEWWVETPEAVDKAPILKFIVGERGQDRGVTLFDVGSGPTPIASWSRTGSTDDYANTLYYTGGGTGTGAEAGGGVVVDIPTQVGQYGQRDDQDGSSSLGGKLDQIVDGAKKRLEALADRTPTFTIGLAFGFWKGREHIDVGDTVRLILRLGKDVTDVKYRVTEIQVDIDENNSEDVTLTLGRPRASNDPRSKRSPLMRIVRKFRNYKAPQGALRDTRDT